MQPAKICRAAVRQVVAVHGRDDGVVEAPASPTDSREPHRLERSSRPRPAVVIAQKPHERVQTSPRIMKVAVPRSKHSPMFGQRASSQTVCSRCSRSSP